MNEKEAMAIANKIFINVFEEKCQNNLEELLEKYAFDIKLPKQVNDSTTNEVTWADSISSGRFITNANMEEKSQKEGWELPKTEVTCLQDILAIWNQINLTTTERVYDSENVSKSDTIYQCQNIYRSTNCYACKNIVYADSCNDSEYMLASQRSSKCTFCIRTDDSSNCSNCYNVICSGKISNSIFVQDCSNLHECMFCSHISDKQYCIANMQFDEEEYFEIKKEIIEWILNS